MKRLLLLLAAASIVLLGQFPQMVPQGFYHLQFAAREDTCDGRTRNGSCFDLVITPTLRPGYIFEVEFDNPSNEPQFYRLWTSDSAHPICLRVDYREFIADEPVFVPCNMETK